MARADTMRTDQLDGTWNKGMGGQGARIGHMGRHAGMHAAALGLLPPGTLAAPCGDSQSTLLQNCPTRRPGARAGRSAGAAGGRGAALEARLFPCLALLRLPHPLPAHDVVDVDAL